jgi:glycolate oxidase FAD binding subunit
MTPVTETELADIIRATKAPFCIRGGGTRPVGHPVEGETLDLSALTGIELYEPGALTLVVRAGTPVAEIEETLAAEGQRLAFEPMDHRPLLGTTGTPTIGGVVALNASGPRRIQVGAVRDFMLGVKFADGQGQMISNGGRVMKNVTGYDLVKLLAGSYGTLGILTEISFKVLPVPETEASLILHGLCVKGAVDAMSAALRSPYEVSGAAHFPHSASDGPSTMLRIEGAEESVLYRMDSLKALLAGHAEMSVIEADASRSAWRQTRDVELFSEATTDGAIWRISAKPSDAPSLIARMGEDVQTQLDWGGGLIWAKAATNTDVRDALGEFDGHATLIRAGANNCLPVFHPQPEPVAQLERGLRARFDPRGLFNQGLMGARG